MKKKRSIPVLKKEAWKAFSWWAKRTRMDEWGHVKCISCNTDYLWHSKGLNSGHLIHGKWKYNGFNPDNVWPQCVYCNLGLAGNEHKYAENLIKIIGKERVDKLYDERKKKFSASREYIEGLIERYK